MPNLQGGTNDLGFFRSCFEKSSLSFSSCNISQKLHDLFRESGNTVVKGSIVGSVETSAANIYIQLLLLPLLLVSVELKKTLGQARDRHQTCYCL